MDHRKKRASANYPSYAIFGLPTCIGWDSEDAPSPTFEPHIHLNHFPSAVQFPSEPPYRISGHHLKTANLLHGIFQGQPAAQIVAILRSMPSFSRQAHIVIITLKAMRRAKY